MAKYELSVQEDSKTEDGNVHATIVVSFDNPKYDAHPTEEYTYTNDEGEEVTDTREIESTEPESFRFEQEILVPENEAERKKIAQSYADDYEKQYLASQE